MVALDRWVDTKQQISPVHQARASAIGEVLLFQEYKNLQQKKRKGYLAVSGHLARFNLLSLAIEHSYHKTGSKLEMYHAVRTSASLHTGQNAEAWVAGYTKVRILPANKADHYATIRATGYTTRSIPLRESI